MKQENIQNWTPRTVSGVASFFWKKYQSITKAFKLLHKNVACEADRI